MPLSDPHANSAALSTLLELLPIGVAIARDPKCAHISVNPAAARMLGITTAHNASLSRPELKLPFKIIHQGEELDPNLLPMQRAAAEGVEFRDFEVELVREDGSLLHLFEYASPLRDAQGKLFGAIGLFVDITSQKQNAAREVEMQREAENRLRELNETLELRVVERTAEARARAEQLRRLALSLADAEARERKRLAQLLHDQLQQVLSAAKLKAGLVRRVASDENLKEQIQQIERLIEGAIAESRSLTIELAPPILYDAGLNPAIEALTRNMEQRHGLKFTVRCDPAAEPEAEQIRVLLFEAVREMLRNVVEHAVAKQVTVTSHASASGHMTMTIEDDGQGFDVETLTQPKDRTDDHHLGLVEIRERLSHIGGDLEICSTPGKGTTVNLHVPTRLREIVADSVRPPASAPAVPGPSMDGIRRARVVVADDHAIFRDGLIGLLKQETFLEVIGEAGDGEQAVALCRKLRPDILIVDVTMPKLSGVEVTQVLSQEQTGLRIIGLSMHDRADMAMAMRRAGACGYLAKGGASEALIALLRTITKPG